MVYTLLYTRYFITLQCWRWDLGSHIHYRPSILSYTPAHFTTIPKHT